MSIRLHLVELSQTFVAQLAGMNVVCLRDRDGQHEMIALKDHWCHLLWFDDPFKTMFVSCLLDARLYSVFLHETVGVCK